MKKFSKILSLILSVLMLMQMTSVVLANDATPYFKVSITDTVTGQAGGYAIVDNFINYVPDEAKFSLMYLSDTYAENIYEPAVFVYTNDDGTQVYMQMDRPLTDVVTGTNGDATSAKLSVPVPAGYSGEYDVKFYLTVAQAKETTDVKPMHGELTLNVSGTAAEEVVVINEAVLNDNEIEYYKNQKDLPPRAYIDSVVMDTESSFVENLTVTPNGEIPSILAWQEDATNFVTVSPYAFISYEGEEPPYGYGKYLYYLIIVDENGDEYTAPLTVNFINEDLVAEDMILLSYSWNYIEDGTDAFGAYDYTSRAIYYYDEGTYQQKIAILDEENTEINYPMFDELLSGTSDGTGHFTEGFVDSLLYSAAILKDTNGDNKYDDVNVACVQAEGVVKSVDGNIVTTVNDDEIDIADCTLVGVNAATEIEAGDVITIGFEMPADTLKAWVSKDTFTSNVEEKVTGYNDYITDYEKTYYVTDGTAEEVSPGNPCEGKLSYFGTALDLVEKESTGGGNTPDVPVVPKTYKLSFMVNGEEYATFDLESGATIPAVDAPVVNNYRFDGWDKLPSAMPAADTVVNAIMTPLSTVHGIVKYNDAAEERVTVSMNGQTYETEADGSFWFTDVLYGDYMLTAEKNGMKTTVAVTVSTSDTNLGDVVLAVKGTDIAINDTSVKTIEGLDAVVDSVITAEDETYLATPGNTINVVATSNTVANNANIDSMISSAYSNYTAAGVYIDITLAKVKGGAETTSTPITETNSLVEFKVEIPASVKDKDEIIVLREHNGAIDLISNLANDNGEYIVRSGDYVTLYLNRFSVYSFAGKDNVATGGGEIENTIVTRPAGGGSSGGSTGGTTAVPETPDDTEDVVVPVFADLDGYDWAKEAITVLSAIGVVNGKTETTFDPAANVTRAEFAKLIVTAFGLEAEEGDAYTFTDVAADDWFAEYVKVAGLNGIISGYEDGSFKPNANISREEMCVMLARALEAYELEATENTFADGTEISDWAKDAVNKLSANGVLTGKDDNKFAPADTATRAESAVVIYRAISLIAQD